VGRPGGGVWRFPWAAATLLLCTLAGPGFAASPQTPPAPPSAESAVSGIAVTGVGGHAAKLTPGALAALPAVSLTISFATGHGEQHGRFSGPLLWTVLSRLGAIDSSSPRVLSHEVVLAIGSDGYAAAIAMGEIAPVFEGKQVILADEMDGHPLAPGHFRIIVPGDRYGGRDVRDVVRIRVLTPPP